MIPVIITCVQLEVRLSVHVDAMHKTRNMWDASLMIKKSFITIETRRLGVGAVGLVGCF